MPIPPKLISSISNNLNVTTSKAAPVFLPSANIKSIPSHHRPSLVPAEEPQPRKSSLLSLRSLSLSLMMMRGRGRTSEGHIDPIIGLKPIEESRKSIFKLDIFEKNLKKFMTRSHEPEFQSYSEYTQQQEQAQAKTSRRPALFKSQKVYARRSSMSDVPDVNINQRPLQFHHASGTSHSASNVKHEHHIHKKHKEQKHVDKTAEMLKEVRKRNLETAKRISAPRRISTAY